MQSFSAKRFGSMVVAASLAAMAAQHADAAVLNAPAHQADAGIYGRGVGSTSPTVWRDDRGQLDAGHNGANYYNTVLVFELPALPSGEFIQSASLQVFLHAVSIHGNADLDLYGLGYRDAPDVLTSDWFSGGELDPNATMLQDSFAAPSVPGRSFVSTDAAGEAALAAFLEAQYAAGAEAGDYVFLRLNTDTDSLLQYYATATADAGISQSSTDSSLTEAHRPTLTITTAPIPEPASLALLGVGGVLALSRRRA